MQVVSGCQDWTYNSSPEHDAMLWVALHRLALEFCALKLHIAQQSAAAQKQGKREEISRIRIFTKKMDQHTNAIKGTKDELHKVVGTIRGLAHEGNATNGIMGELQKIGGMMQQIQLDHDKNSTRVMDEILVMRNALFETCLRGSVFELALDQHKKAVLELERENQGLHVVLQRQKRELEEQKKRAEVKEAQVIELEKYFEEQMDELERIIKEETKKQPRVMWSQFLQLVFFAFSFLLFFCQLGGLGIACFAGFDARIALGIVLTVFAFVCLV